MNDLPDLNLPLASHTALLAGTLGRAMVWAAVALFAIGFFQNLFFPRGAKVGTGAFVLGCAALFGTIIDLGVLLVQNQFEYHYVWEHSDAGSPLQYKIASIWSGQEGSFLLWAVTSAVFALLTLWGTGAYRRWYVAAYSVFLACLAAILCYESPFVLQLFHNKPYVPPDGAGLNNALQNYWVVIHPPTIFLGFGSLTVLFAYAISALLTRSYDDWARRARPWALVSLSLVGLGLCMGGFWAYETLGWGGFWKWDPVENTSFVPWVTVAALVHGFIVQGTKRKWKFSNLFLGGLPYLLFVYGTFLTRSGFLTAISVHSFAEMEHTAHMVLLIYCIAACAFFIGLWLWRWIQDGKESSFDKSAPAAASPAQTQDQPGLKVRDVAANAVIGTDREGWYRVGNILLCLVALATAIGMSVPLVQYAMGKSPKVVEERLYHEVLVWFFIPIMVMMAAAPFVSWRKMPWGQLWARVFTVFCLTIGGLGIIMMVIKNPRFGIPGVPGDKIDIPFGKTVPTMFLVITLLGFCIFAMMGNLWRICELWKRSKPAASAFLAHIGVAVAMAGLIVSRGFERIQLYPMQEGEVAQGVPIDENTHAVSATPLPYHLALEDVNEDALESKSNKLHIDVSGGDGGPYVAKPVFYMFADENGDPKQFAWPSIHHELSHDTYLSIGGRDIQAGDPATLKQGETVRFLMEDPQTMAKLPYEVTYVKMVRQGQPGQPGTKFLAQLKIGLPNGETVDSAPGMQIAGGGIGPQFIPAMIDGDYFVTMMRMDAADQSATIQFNYVHPVYYAALYYKPMVILVWIGAGIMTLGGLWSAWYRRKNYKSMEA